MIVRLCAIALIMFLLLNSGNSQITTGSVSSPGGILSFWNPAIISEGQGNVELWVGELQSSLYNSSFAMEDIISASDGQNIINFRDVVDRVSESNRGIAETILHTAGIQWKDNNLSLGLGHRIRYMGDIAYSGDFVQLIHRGNAGFIGQQIEAGPGFAYFHYNELYLTAAWKINGLSLGGRIKMLAGSEYMGTEHSTIRLTTLEDYYALEFSNDYLVRSSGILSYNGLNDVAFDFDPFRLQKFFSGNRGWAFDFGATLEVGDQGLLMASISDVGSINWDINTTTYESKGDFVYEGIDILDYVADNERVVFSDSLYQLLQFQETKNIDFTTTIPWQWTLGYSSEFRENDKLSIFIFGKSLESRNILSAMLGYHRRWSEMFATSFSYMVSGKSYNNLGATAFLDFDILSFYLGMDNIINVIRPLGTKHGGIHLGMHFKL